MKVRMSMTTAVAVVTIGLLGACGTDDPDTGTEPDPTPSRTSDAPSAEPTDEAVGTPETAADLVGTWRAEEADWTVRFAADGTFVEDYEGVQDFRTGTYALEDGVVTIEGGDGNATEGTVEGSSLVFRLGTLERQ